MRARKLVSYSEEGSCHYQFCLSHPFSPYGDQVKLVNPLFDELAFPKYEYMTYRDLLVTPQCVRCHLITIAIYIRYIYIYTLNFGFGISNSFIIHLLYIYYI